MGKESFFQKHDVETFEKCMILFKIKEGENSVLSALDLYLQNEFIF
jgi:hypothetical protein